MPVAVITAWALAVAILAGAVGGGRARLLTAEEQVVGRWEVDFRRGMMGWLGRGRRLDSILRGTSSSSSSSSSSTEQGDGGIPHASRCVLSFDGAGRFTLEVAEDGGRDHPPTGEAASSSASSSSPREDDAAEGMKSDEPIDDRDEPPASDGGGAMVGVGSTSSTKMAGTAPPPPPPPLLRGTWRVRPNPYCVTDRFFDELSLRCPYPRGGTDRRRRGDDGAGDGKIGGRGRGGGGGGGGAAAVERWRTERRSRIELRGRVSGRYGARSVRRLVGIDDGVDGRGRSRITHGTVVLVREGGGRRPRGRGKGRGRGGSWIGAPSSWWGRRRRVVIGSFRATPLSPPCPGAGQSRE